MSNYYMFLGRPRFGGEAAEGEVGQRCGFNLSTVIASKRSPSFTMKNFSALCITLYGPL
jgi:hypothetical protein